MFKLLCAEDVQQPQENLQVAAPFVANNQVLTFFAVEWIGTL